MRTSLNDIRHTEAWLQGTLPAADKLLFEARIILSPLLKEQVARQQQVYQIVQAYGRKQMKAEIETVHSKLFSERKHQSFSQRIRAIFHRK